MKKLCFILGIGVIICTLGLLFTSCDSEQISSLENSTPLVSQEDSSHEYTPEQVTLLNQLKEINNKFASDSTGTTTLAETRTSQYLKVVATADARGFKQGWEFGRKNGKGFFSRLFNGMIAATITSFIYSASAAISYPLCGQIYLRTPDVNTTVSLTAKILGSEEGQQKIAEYRDLFGDIIEDGTEEEFIGAACHNILLEEYVEGQIYPAYWKEQVFSENELSYYSSPQFAKYHSSIPSIVNGSTNFYRTFIITPDKFENEVFNQYINGLNNLAASTDETLKLKTKELCKEYISTVNSSNALEEDSKYCINGSLYILPLSVNHWVERSKNY